MDEITPLMARQEQLLDLARIIGPINRLVNQNLLINTAQLAGHVSEVIGIADVNKKSKPQLIEGLKNPRTWSKKHHPGRGPGADSTEEDDADVDPAKAAEPAPKDE